MKLYNIANIGSGATSLAAIETLPDSADLTRVIITIATLLFQYFNNRQLRKAAEQDKKQLNQNP